VAFGNAGQSTNPVGYTLTFGKYSGQQLSSVPLDYVEWLADDAEKRLALWQAEIKRRETAEAATVPMSEALVEAGYKALAQKYHPDKGGDAATFQELAGARELLRATLRELRSQGDTTTNPSKA